MRLAGLSYPAALELLRLVSKACSPTLRTVSHSHTPSGPVALSFMSSNVVLFLMAGTGVMEEKGRAVFLHITSCPGQVTAGRAATGCSHWGTVVYFCSILNWHYAIYTPSCWWVIFFCHIRKLKSLVNHYYEINSRNYDIWSQVHTMG